MVLKTMQLVSLMIFLFFLFITTVHSQTSASLASNNTAFCCNSKPSPQIVPAPINFIDAIYESPNYGQTSTLNPHSLSLDNVCYTYCEIDGTSFVQFTGLHYSDGTTKIEKYIVSALNGYTGVSRIQGLTDDTGASSLVYDEVYLGRACPGMRVYFRNTVAAQCDGLRTRTQGEADFIHADSPNRDIDDYCDDQVIELATSQQLRATKLFRLPNKLNRCCVTQFNGASCVNAERVLPQDSVSVPDTDNSQRCTNILCILFLKPSNKCNCENIY